MAETLRRLVNLGSYSVLQEKLERWQDNFALNTNSLNASTCTEVIELNAQIQSQLFKILSLVSDGTSYSKLRTRFPYYHGYWPHGYYYPDYYWSELSVRERELREVKDTYERSLQDVEDDLLATREEADDLHNELEETKAELQDEKRQSTSSKIITESEVRELRTKLSLAEDELVALRPRVGLISDYERQIRRLRDDIAVLSGHRSALTTSVDLDPPLKSSLRSTLSSSALDNDDVTQRVRQSALITRFNDMFAQDRLEAMETLRKFSDDYENNQRIVFAAMQEAFTTAKLAFANYKMRIRSNLASTHLGPETLEEAVQDYINRNTDLYDLPALVNDVVRALNRNTRLLLPGEVTFTIVKPFVREACKLAWEMSALANPLDIAIANDSELFDDKKYRRSYDSEYSAALVSHHIWPCLQQGIRVLMKGEACTKRGSTTLRSSRSLARSSSPLRTRSTSPLRSMSPRRIRSRSPSPRRSALASGKSSALRKY